MSILAPRPSVPSFPLDCLPPFWAEWAIAQAERKGAPVDYVGAGLLAVASALIGNARWVEVWDGWIEPPFLWCALIGAPSSGKSPALDAVLSPLAAIEHDLLPGYEEAMQRFERDKEEAAIREQDWKSEVKEAVKVNRPAPPRPVNTMPPEAPPRPRLRVMDATTEALVERLAANPKGLLYQRDELAGWLGNMDRYAGGKGGDRPFFLESFGGRPYIADRVKHGGKPLHIPHAGLSILGGIQPDRFDSLLKQADDDGLAARFLPFFPDRLPPSLPRPSPHVGRAEQALRRLHALRMPIDEGGSPARSFISFTAEAVQAMQNFRLWRHSNEPEGGILASWYGKLDGYAARLALVLELLAWCTAPSRPEPVEIPLDTFHHARRMIETYFVPMSARAFGLPGLPQAAQDAAALANWILREQPKKINLRQLYRNGTAGLKTAEQAEAVAQMLVAASWLREDGSRSGGAKGRMSGDYAVNPAVFEPRRADNSGQ
jgi:hypothetical protein